MTIHDIIAIFQFFFLFYFLGLNSIYLALNVVSIWNILGYLQRQELDRLPPMYLGMEPPISVLAPAYNEEATIVTSISSLLQLKYNDYEIVVIVDGATDRTLEIMIAHFQLEPFPEAYRVRLETKPVLAIYHSVRHPNLRVVHKENGGKADALNAGINCARYPLYCAVDADSILQRESLERVVQPFLEDPTTVAAGGCIRVANGCHVEDGFMIKAGLARKPLAVLQTIEYLRAFLFGRLGWSPLNAMLIISGAFGLFNKEKVIEAGGYRTDTVGEDMELVVRLHRINRQQKKPYKIVFVPDPICWTEVPENLKTLRSQRIRWQRGLGESLKLNKGLLFHKNSGLVGWVAFPYMLVFELLGPMLEVAGYVFMIVCFFLGLLNAQAMLIFLFLSVGLGTLLSLTALLLEEISYRIYTRFSDLGRLLLAVVFENFGYRQLLATWRAFDLIRWALGGKSKWGEMKRSATWRKDAPVAPGAGR